MIERDIEETARRLLRGFPILTVTGPRQSGKTTLARKLFVDKPYLSLEDPDTRQLAGGDPRAFLARLPDGAVLDEIQRAPDLLSYLQTRVDADGRMGLFLLTGSQQFGLVAGVTQSLAGRSAFLQLLPFSSAELDRAGLLTAQLDEALFAGGYPPLHDRRLAPRDWFPAYVTAYVERDVRQLLNVQDLETFQRFVKFCAGRSGQILNLSTLAADCGITHNTAKAWISVLEASYILFLLRPHHANFNKRLVKSPKLYFLDTGLLCWLLGIQQADQLATHPLRGAIFETWVVAELVKARFNQGLPLNMHFWRDSHGNEVDVIADMAGNWLPIEIKAGQTLNRDFTAGLERWSALAGERAVRPALVYGGGASMIHQGIRVRAWRDAATLLASQAG